MYQLIIGNKNYSSWSLRPWLLLKVAAIPFEEINIPLYTDQGKQQLREFSSAAKVPILMANGMTIWDSLAIVEYLAEQHPEKALWPLANDSRAIARSVVSEMHSGFNHLRQALPMNCKCLTQYDDIGQDLQQDIDRICQIWRNCRQEFGAQGQFLFGNFSIADAFFAPVVMRFHSYRIPLEEPEQHYLNTVLSLPAMQDWIETAKAETMIVDEYELA